VAGKATETYWKCKNAADHGKDVKPVPVTHLHYFHCQQKYIKKSQQSQN